MKTFEALRSALQRETVAAYEFRGQTLHFQKLGAKAGIALQKAYESLPKTDDGKVVSDIGGLVDFMVELLAQTLVDEDTLVRACDSDEGRELLRSMPVDALIELGTFSAKHSGLAKSDAEEAKKKSTTPTGDS